MWASTLKYKNILYLFIKRSAYLVGTLRHISKGLPSDCVWHVANVWIIQINVIIFPPQAEKSQCLPPPRRWNGRRWPAIAVWCTWEIWVKDFIWSVRQLVWKWGRIVTNWAHFFGFCMVLVCFRTRSVSGVDSSGAVFSARYQNELAGVETEQLAERFYHQALSVMPHVGEWLSSLNPTLLYFFSFWFSPTSWQSFINACWGQGPRDFS